MIWNVVSSSIFYASAFRLTVLFALAATGEWVAERAGTLNISLEGMITAGAFGAALGSSTAHNVWVGLLYASAAGLLVAAVQANMSHRLTANQFIVGLTLNVLVVGLTAFLDAELQPVTQRAGVVEIPLLSRLPLVGEAFFAQAWPAYAVYLAIPLAWWLVYRTRWGLEVRACGENPQSSDVSGIHVNRRRRQSIYFCGILGGYAGGFLAIGQVGSFSAEGVAGRGFIAIAAVIFGGWTLKGTIAGAAVFGSAQALGSVLQALGYRMNAQLLTALPYVLALLTMLLFAHRTRQPRALGQSFVRGLT